MSEEIRRRMRRQAQSDTKPEMALRRELHRRGLRYRVDHPPLPQVRRRADVVFPRRKVAVFVDGCFWHSCPTHGTLPKTNREWWQEKLERNRLRDRETDAALSEAGWTVLRFWEHENPVEAADEVESAIFG
jgi:DNA mismatch endonuclease, patch repair protein